MIYLNFEIPARGLRHLRWLRHWRFRDASHRTVESSIERRRSAAHVSECLATGNLHHANSRGSGRVSSFYCIHVAAMTIAWEFLLAVACRTEALVPGGLYVAAHCTARHAMYIRRAEVLQYARTYAAGISLIE